LVRAFPRSPYLRMGAAHEDSYGNNISERGYGHVHSPLARTYPRLPDAEEACSYRSRLRLV